MPIAPRIGVALFARSAPEPVVGQPLQRPGASDCSRPPHPAGLMLRHENAALINVRLRLAGPVNALELRRLLEVFGGLVCGMADTQGDDTAPASTARITLRDGSMSPDNQGGRPRLDVLIGDVG